MTQVKKKTSEKQVNTEGFASYLKGVKLEWGRVTWPERRQIVTETLIVLGIVFLFTTLIYVMDKIFFFILHRGA